MLTDIYFILALLASYLIGSLSSAIAVCLVFRLPDPRSAGSNNPGATNVLRIGGKLPALLTLLGDMLKGTAPVLLCTFYFLPWQCALVLLCAVLGHMYPVFFKFQGGKGVATAIGGLIGLDWRLAAGFGVTWLTVAVLTRYSSLAALVAICVVPGISIYLGQIYMAGILGALALMVIWRHRENIQRLLTGNESKIGKKAS